MTRSKKKARPSTTLATAVRQHSRPASRGPATPSLTLIHGGDLGRRFDLDETQRNVVAGRDPSVFVHIDDETVSRRHAKFYVKALDDGALQVWVSDLGSTNGVFVNELQVGEQELRSGDKIHLGDTILRFEWLDQFDRVFHDRIAERVRAAAVDPTTGLLTKRFFSEELPSLTIEWSQDGRGYALILLDVDDFKTVNDRFGHPVGDRVLAQVATLVRGSVRTNDIAIRYGGDELVVVLPRAGEEDAIAVAARVCDAVRREPWSAIQPGLAARVSQGVAAWREGDDLDTVFRRTDRALYQAKESGRDRVDVADDSRAT